MDKNRMAPVLPKSQGILGLFKGMLLATFYTILVQQIGAQVSTTNQVLSLDGNGSYVTVPSAPELHNPSEITIEAWIRPQQAIQNNTLYINKSDNVSGGSSRSYELQWVANADSAGPGKSVRFIVFLNNGSWAVVSAPAAEDQWVHVAASFSSIPGVLQLYTNGVLAVVTTKDAGGSSPLTGTLLRQTTLPVRFGAAEYSPYYYARGYMDEIRIWNKARTPEEISRDRSLRLSGAESNLAGYWTFNDGMANDLTGHGHNGTLIGNARTVSMALPEQPQTANQVLTLDGNGSYVTIPSAPELQNPSEITIEAWIRPQQASQNNSAYIIKSDGATGESSRSYELSWVANADSAGPGKSFRIVVFLNNGSWAWVGAPAAEDQWVHVAASFSSIPGVLQLYTNGVLAVVTTKDAGGSSPLTGTLLRQTTLPVRFGAADSPYYYARGHMDEIRIWNKARSQAEIQSDIYQQLSGTEANLMAYWNFDDGSAHDQTGRGHDGTFILNAKAVAMELPKQTAPLPAIQRVLSLKGNSDYVTIPSAADLQSSNQVTIETWIYPVPNATNPNAYFLSKGAGSNLDSPRTYELSWTPDNRAYFSLFTGQSTWSLLGAPVPEYQWTHIAATFNGADGWFRLYTNGVMAAATTNDLTGQFPLLGQSLRQTSLPLVLGCSFSGAPLPGTFATGQMDEVRIWNRALSGQEILQGICQRLSGSESNLVSNWNFDDGTAHDITGHGHDGTLAGQASIVPMNGFDIIHNVIGFNGATFDRRGQVVLSVTARNGANIRIDASTNLVDWVTVGTVLNNQGTVQFTDPDTLKFIQRFYRAVLP